MLAALTDFVLSNLVLSDPDSKHSARTKKETNSILWPVSKCTVSRDFFQFYPSVPFYLLIHTFANFGEFSKMLFSFVDCVLSGIVRSPL